MGDLFIIYEDNFNKNLKKIKSTTDNLLIETLNTSTKENSLNDNSLTEAINLISENEKIVNQYRTVNNILR